MPVETTDTMIRVRVREPEEFIGERSRTISIYESEGISSVLGKLSGEDGSVAVQDFMFLISKGWTEEKATAWCKEHGHEPKGLVLMSRKSLGDLEHPARKSAPIFDFKSSTDEDGSLIIEGYANTKNHADRYGDVPKAFDALRSYVYELTDYLKNPVMLIDHVNSIDHVAASVVAIAENEIGLHFKAKFSKSDLPLIAHARTVYSEGHAKGISIAGRFHYENPADEKQLTLAEIFEISLVGVGADPQALAMPALPEEQRAAPELKTEQAKVESGLDKIAESLNLLVLKQDLRELDFKLSKNNPPRAGQKEA